MVKIRGSTTDGIMAMASHHDTLQPGIRGRNYQCDWLRGDGIRTELRVKVFCLYRYYVFDVHVTVYLVNSLIIKPTRCTDFSNLFSE